MAAVNKTRIHLLNLDSDSFSFEVEGGSETVKVSSNGEWAVLGNTKWCKISHTKGYRELTITITVLENDSFDDRDLILVFTCGKETAELEISQFGKIKSNYVDIDWDANTIISYDESDGEINIRYSGDISLLKENRAIVLPEDYEYDIRIIKSISVSGNTITLQTEQGNMSNLFMNISFILATDPSYSETARLPNYRIITPSKIRVSTENGYNTIYEREISNSRSDYQVTANLFTFNQDFSGNELYKEDRNKIYWEKCIFDFGLKGVFKFDFGRELIGEELLPVGELKKFEWYMDGALNVDLLLKYIFEIQTKKEKETVLIPDLIKDVQFIFLVGSVHVPVTVGAHLCSRYEFETNAEVTLNMGCNFRANAKLGMNYTPETNVSPIMSFSPSFTVYEPTFTAKGSLEAKGTIYPKINIKLYKFAGTSIEPMPYLREELEGGLKFGAADDYLAWTSKSYAGLDCRMRLSLEFAKKGFQIWESEIYNLKDDILFEAPKKNRTNIARDWTRNETGRIDKCYVLYNFI